MKIYHIFPSRGSFLLMLSKPKLFLNYAGMEKNLYNLLVSFIVVSSLNCLT